MLNASVWGLLKYLIRIPSCGRLRICTHDPLSTSWRPKGAEKDCTAHPFLSDRRTMFPQSLLGIVGFAATASSGRLRIALVCLFMLESEAAYISAGGKVK